MPSARHPRLILLTLVLLALACNFPTLTATPSPTAAPSSPSPFPLSPIPLTPAPPPTRPSSTAATDPLPLSPTPLTPSPFPSFEPAPCAFPVPEGYEPDCGYLVVPENRDRPGSPSLRLHTAIFRSRSPDPASDPVVHLAGGPGSSSTEVAGYLLAVGLDAVLERRDLILFDQRGTGYSEPRLDCPEREALVPDLLGGRLSPAEESEAILAAFRSCRERLAAAGVDLAAYNSAASAADLNDLRLALGVEQLNLYGVSYGTRLALTLMRAYPEAVRSAVLDSTYPLQVNLYTALASNAERAFGVFFALCEADPGCRAGYPDLELVFFELVDELNASPRPLTFNLGGAERAVLLDGGLLVDVLFGGLYNPAVTASMPGMIFGIRQGETTILRQRLAQYFEGSAALGLQMAVQCAEEIPFSPAQEAFRAAQGVRPQIAAFFPASVQPLFAACREWNPAPPDPRENQPVSSSLPALILAGEFDPITPPDWGRLAAADLPNSFFHEVPANGHWVTRSSPCALRMALAFWDDPTSPPDPSCLQSPGGLETFR